MEIPNLLQVATILKPSHMSKISHRYKMTMKLFNMNNAKPECISKLLEHLEEIQSFF